MGDVPKFPSLDHHKDWIIFKGYCETSGVQTARKGEGKVPEFGTAQLKLHPPAVIRKRRRRCLFGTMRKAQTKTRVSQNSLGLT
jgi:hypothetical protein